LKEAHAQGNESLLVVSIFLDCMLVGLLSVMLPVASSINISHEDERLATIGRVLARSLSFFKGLSE
jgi:hypothetical protein